MGKLLLLATGGTIACVPGDGGLEPSLSARQLLDCLDGAYSHVECMDLFNMDSSNIQPEEWIQIADRILWAASCCQGIVVTHGTDTMAYTASMLSFMLRNIPIPVVLTGSQYPMVYPDSDGRKNLMHALIAADQLPGGVYVCFGGSIMLGCRAVKTRTTSLAAFESINFPYIGAVINGRYVSLFQRQSKGTFEFCSKIVPDVALVKLIPGASPRLIESLWDCGIKGVVVEAFGLGGVHNVRRDHVESLKKLMQQGVPVVLASQCLYEASTPDVYQVSRPLREAGVISALDMTTEAAVTKLMWVLAKSSSFPEIRRMMQTDYCGEITAPPLQQS